MNGIKEKLGLSNGQLIALIAIAVLNILWLVCRFATFTGEITYKTFSPILMLAITVFYVIYGYKKPHGNHIRYLLLIYAVHMSSILIANQTQLSAYYSALNIAAVILSTYMAGRLDRFKQNVIISIIIAITQIIYIYPFINRYIQNNTLSFVNFFKSVGPVSLWLAIAASYIVRFKPHKEAGLEDKQ